MHRWFLLVLAALLQLAFSPAPSWASSVDAGVAASGAGRIVACDHRMQGSWGFDGVYGPFTQLAVRQFQRDHHLTADGVAGPQTLRALGWPASRIVLKCGASGTTVQRLQMSLAKHDYWALGVAARLESPSHPSPKSAGTPFPVAVKPSTPSPKPTAPVRPRPTPAPASPRPSPRPVATPRPTPTPWVEPSMAPATPEPSPTASPNQVVVPLPPDQFVHMPEMRPLFLELSAGAWVNTVSSGTDAVLNPALPSWTYAGTLWHGAWGLGGELVRFNPVGGTAAPQRFFQGNTNLWDAQLKYRFNEGHTVLAAGYRQLSQSSLDFVTLSLCSRQPLAGDWLSFQVRGLVGGNVNAAYTVDATTGLSLDVRPVSVGLGYRLLSVSRVRSAEPVYFTAGPTAGLTIAF